MSLWYEAISEAQDLIDDKVQVDIQGYDMDNDMIKIALEAAIEL